LEKKNDERGDVGPAEHRPATVYADVPDNQYMDGQLAERGCELLEELAATGKPFFLSVGFLNSLEIQAAGHGTKQEVGPDLSGQDHERFWGVGGAGQERLGGRQTSSGRNSQRNGEQCSCASVVNVHGAFDCIAAFHLVAALSYAAFNAA
jgi:hypothetical protein